MSYKFDVDTVADMAQAMGLDVSAVVARFAADYREWVQKHGRLAESSSERPPTCKSEDDVPGWGEAHL